MIFPQHFADVVELVEYHIRLRDGVELRDIYKLLHQSVFGPEHLGEGASEGAIAEEMRKAEEAGFEEAPLEPISIDARACRVNLRAARRLGIPASLIANAMSRSAKRFECDRGAFGRLWRELGNSLNDLSKKFTFEDYEELFRTATEKGFPPLRHSSSYRELNRPAYRVLIKDELERLMRETRARGR